MTCKLMCETDLATGRLVSVLGQAQGTGTFPHLPPQLCPLEESHRVNRQAFAFLFEERSQWGSGRESHWPKAAQPVSGLGRGQASNATHPIPLPTQLSAHSCRCLSWVRPWQTDRRPLDCRNLG